MSTDPYKYFRIEARELLDGLAQGVLQLEKGAGQADLVQRLLRLAHTLKGAARVVRQPEIAERSHALEDVLTEHRDGGGAALSSTRAGELLRLVDEMSARLDALDGGPLAELVTQVAAQVSEQRSEYEPIQTQVQAPARETEELRESLRVEIDEMDELTRGAAELRVQTSALLRVIGTAEQSRDMARALVAVERVVAQLDEVQDTLHKIRLVPVRTVFPTLERAARDAAQTLGMRVEFHAQGGDVRLDASVLRSMRDALAHVVRNAVTHGIEPEAQRRSAGKPAAGQVRLSVERRGSRVGFACSDDGRGIDVEAVRRAAVARGQVSGTDAASLSRAEVMTLLGTGGLSTSARVTELSGRGIGLDVARAATASLKGELNIASTEGRGTTIELLVPVSIASVQGLVVESGEARASIPLDSVRATRRVTVAELAHTPERESIHHEGRFIPFLLLDRLLPGARPAAKAAQSWSAVIVQSGEQVVAIGVDRLRGTSGIVMRPLPKFLEADEIVFGASLDADGNPQIVLDPDGLVAVALRENNVSARTSAEKTERAPILVIDDSLTTRMLEQSILESAGYEVELAVSAEEGLEKARARRYSLFVVDVEMPGMTGFDFVTLTRADPVLGAIPAILVTSRNEPEDFLRGKEAGASAYIVKGEFDQGLLLQQIRRLVGE